MFVTEDQKFLPAYRDLAKVHYLMGNGADGLENLNRSLQAAVGDVVEIDSGEAHYHRGSFLRQLATSDFAELLAGAYNTARVYQEQWMLANRDNDDLPRPIRQALAAQQLTAAQRRLLDRHLVASDLEFKQLVAAVATARNGRRRILEMALAELQQAETEWTSANLHYEKAIALAELRRVEDARDTLSKGLEVEPDNLKLLNQRGAMFVLLGDQGKARADYQRAAASQPIGDRDQILLAEARTWCGYFAARAKEARQAEREATRALLHLRDVLPTEKEIYVVLHNMACIYGELAKWDEEQRTALEDEALTYLARAVIAAEEHGEGETILSMIAGEKAFGPNLRKRHEFRDIAAGKQA